MTEKYDAFKDELERLNAQLDLEQEQEARERVKRLSTRLFNALAFVDKLQNGLTRWTSKLSGLVIDRQNDKYGKPHLNVGNMVYMIQLVYDRMDKVHPVVEVGDELSLERYDVDNDVWTLVNTDKFYSIQVYGWDLVQEMRRAWLYGTFDAVKG